MNQELTLKDLFQRKIALEKAIADLVMQFHRENGLTVSRINIDNRHYVTDDGQIEHLNTWISIKFEEFS